jgi:hypothetical protein
MSLKGDPDMHLNKVLKKYNLEAWKNDIYRRLDAEPGSPAALKKHFISILTGEDYYAIDLKDPVTWGDVPEDVKMPPDQAFLDMYKAIVMDQKRRDKRSSYEF